jgi:hypothetical protein
MTRETARALYLDAVIEYTDLNVGGNGIVAVQNRIGYDLMQSLRWILHIQ